MSRVLILINPKDTTGLQLNKKCDKLIGFDIEPGCTIWDGIREVVNSLEEIEKEKLELKEYSDY